MPFVANTPESLIGRSDSLNPNETCRGITSNGRPCRRPVVGMQQPKPSKRPTTPDLRDENLYCWQHKDQASRSAQSSPGPNGGITPILENRSSIDTLADRLGLVDLQEKHKRRKDHRKSSNNSTGSFGPTNSSRPTKPSSLQFCCCFSIPIEESSEPRPPRPQPRPVQHTSASLPPSRRDSRKSHNSQHLSAAAGSSGKSSKSRKSSSSYSGPLIPDTLDAATSSALTAELNRPFVGSEEPGFIYMFWLTPTSDSAPPVDAARSLLKPPSPGNRSRRPSDVVSRFADQSSATTGKTMMLKIGRAANVQRRMNQWQRQCGYEIELLRYYPYLSNADESSGVVPHMTTHCHRVERLIHIELGGMGLRANKDNCEACGKDHKEWFEVEATREGIRTVDGIIRRWIRWDESNA